MKVLPAFVALLALPCASASWRDSLEAELEARYQVTHFGQDRLVVKEKGAVFVIRKEGVTGPSPYAWRIPEIRIENGEVRRGQGFVAKSRDRGREHSFAIGERVYVQKIEVKEDEVQVFVLSAEPVETVVAGTERRTRFLAELAFQFPGGVPRDVDAVTRAVEDVLAPEEVYLGFANISLGQPESEVRAALGEPNTVADLGAKRVLVFDRLKVILVDGVVTDVE